MPKSSETMDVSAEEQQPVQIDAMKPDAMEIQAQNNDEFSEDVAVDFDTADGDDGFDYRYQSNRGGFR